MTHSDILEACRNVVLILVEVPKGKGSANQEDHDIKKEADEEGHQEHPDYSQEVLEAIRVGSTCCSATVVSLKVCCGGCGIGTAELYAYEGQSPKSNEDEHKYSHCEGSQKGAWLVNEEISASFKHNDTNFDFPLEAAEHHDQEGNHEEEEDPSDEGPVGEAEEGTCDQQDEHEHYHGVEHAFRESSQQDHQQYRDQYGQADHPDHCWDCLRHTRNLFIRH